MQIMGYNRFISTDGEKTVLLLSSEDFNLDVEGTLRIRDNLRGYRVDICLIPESLKDSYTSSELIKSILGNLHIGNILTAQFLFYEEDHLARMFSK